MKLLARIATIFLLLLCQQGRLDAAAFRYGIDMIASGDGPCTCKTFTGKRVGLITNAGALSIRGEPSWQAFVRRGVDLKFIMAPEHGFALKGAAGEEIGNMVIADTLKVYSLYGSSRKPDPELLKKIDVLAFDLQDVGTRCYTYISTMKLAMEACDKVGIKFVVFDRPNPVAPLPVGGFMLEPSQESFVGAAGLPFLHGMTVGEIALWLQKSRFPGLSLEVVRMRGYSHRKFADELDGFRFVAPSPNIRDLEAAVLYPATVMLEATAVSEGRGTEAPFGLIGAPFIDADAMKTELERFTLPGVEFVAARFTPSESKFVGRPCSGVRIRVIDRASFDPFRTSTAILLSLQKLYPQELGLSRNAAFFDRLAGTSRYRVMIQKQYPIGAILEAASGPVAAFDLSWPDRFLYP
jgi:uncharacterized protein YbbC (DUF1343 family)